jgi:hypothetical protein
VRLTATKIGTRVAVSQERHDRGHLPDDIQMRCVSHSFRRPNMLYWDSMVYRENASKGSTLLPIEEDNPRNTTGIAPDSRNQPRVVSYDASTFSTGSIGAMWRTNRDSERSSFSEYRSFVTALTHRTGSLSRFSLLSNQTRPSVMSGGTGDQRWSVQTFLTSPALESTTEATSSISPWYNTLRAQNIVPNWELENWSQGRGQHAEYQSNERDLIPLIFESNLGNGATARVESVRCMRVRLVRKVIRCNRRTRLNRDDALQEVLHLYRAQDSHIVRLVGTYVIDDELVILTYPCAEWNLEQFMSTTSTATDAGERLVSIRTFFTCLAKALDFIHSLTIKHMDIKPQNILVRDIRHSSINGYDSYKIYLTDFGSSKFYPSIEDTETDGYTPFTRGYAAQEVVLQESRGLPADVFSMGCVFTEMLATFLDIHINIVEGELQATAGIENREELLKARAGTDGKVRPYYSRVEEVQLWLANSAIMARNACEKVEGIIRWTLAMLEKNPVKRPTARTIAEDTALFPPCLSCTLRPGPEEFEAAPPLVNPTVVT